MQLATFEKLLRKIIREEVNKAIRREFTVLKEELTSNSSDSKPLIESNKEELNKFRSELKKQMPTPNFSTGNNILNSLLNETAISSNFEDEKEIYDPVSKFLNKDYSYIMSAMEEKKHYRP